MSNCPECGSGKYLSGYCDVCGYGYRALAAPKPPAEWMEALESLADDWIDDWISDSEDEASCPTYQSRGPIECAEDLRTFIKQHAPKVPEGVWVVSWPGVLADHSFPSLEIAKGYADTLIEDFPKTAGMNPILIFPLAAAPKGEA